MQLNALRTILAAVRATPCRPPMHEPAATIRRSVHPCCSEVPNWMVGKIANGANKAAKPTAAPARATA